MRRRALVVCTTAFAGLGCGGSDLVLPNTRAPARLTIESGDFQTGPAGTLLPNPLVVRVTDAADRPVEGVTIAFSAEGDGEIFPATTDTDAQGRVTARWMLDRDPGTQQADARVIAEDAPANLAVTFTATASAGERPRLEVITQPSSTARTGVAFERQPRVRVADVDADDRDGIAVVAALASGTGTLGGTTNRQTNGSGVAEFTDLYIDGPPGSYTLLFSAVGVAGAASDPVQLTAARSPSTIRILEHTPDPSDVGQSVLVRVAVEAVGGGDVPNGPFTVTASTGEVCSGETDSGTCGLIFNSAGTRTLVARYPGAGDFEPSESVPVSHTVNPVANPTETIVGTDPDPSEAGEAVTIFVTVRSSGKEKPEGTVLVYDQSPRCGEGEFLGQVELNGKGQATLTTTQLEVGFHIIRACYTGTAGFAPSEDIAHQTVVDD